MAYIVNRRDGTVIATIADGTLNTTATSITLLGKGFNNYGEIIAEDYVHMIEHFAAVDAPPNALRGQLWFDTNAGEEKLKVNVSAITGVPNWVDIQGAIISPTEPTSGFGVGTFWFDLNSNELSVSTDGTTFTSLKAVFSGPTQPAPPNDPGDLWYDETTKELKVFAEDIHGQLGTDDFDVVSPPRYSDIKPTTDRADGDFWWDAVNKQLFVFDTTTNDYRLIGPNTSITVLGGNTNIEGDTFGGIPILKIIIDGEIIGIWSGQDIDVTSLTGPEQTELTGFSPKIFRGLTLNKNLGPSSEQTLFGGPATEAFYADLAERYAVDGPVEAGELVSLGGEAEITKTTVENDFNIFGVVSTNPGMKLNASAGNDETHPYIALIGRVPCKVVGAVNKGDRLVSSSIPGVARVVTPGEIMKVYPAIFGRVLETNLDEEIKIIEVTIGVK